MMQVMEIDIVGIGECVDRVPRDFVPGMVAERFEGHDGGEPHALPDGEPGGWESKRHRDAIEEDGFDGVHVECGPAPGDIELVVDGVDVTYVC